MLFIILPISILLLMISILALLVFYFDILNTKFKPIEKLTIYKADKLTKVDNDIKKLKVLTYNIKFGAGRVDMFFDCHGDNYRVEKEEVVQNITKIAHFLKKIDPDVVLIQELDINSDRTGKVDQIKQLLEKTDLNYAVFGSQWRVKYVPKYQIGNINSGNLILSKYQLFEPKRYQLPVIETQSFLTKFFYLKRNFIETYIKINGEKIYLYNLHASAYATDGTKEKQLKIFFNHIDKKDKNGDKFIAGGDFNTLPPYTKKVKNFPDQVCKNLDWGGENLETDQKEHPLKRFYKFNPAIDLEIYKKDNSPFFTHTTDKKGFWNRKLDYIFTNLKTKGGKVYQSIENGGFNTMELSDHAPVEAEILLK